MSLMAARYLDTFSSHITKFVTSVNASRPNPATTCDLFSRGFFACSRDIHHIRNWCATSHRCRYLFCAHLPKWESNHSGLLAVHPPVLSLQCSNSFCFAAYQAVLLRLHTRRKGKPSAKLPSYERFRVHQSRSR